jgi:hypothetical protein
LLPDRIRTPDPFLSRSIALVARSFIGRDELDVSLHRLEKAFAVHFPLEHQQRSIDRLRTTAVHFHFHNRTSAILECGLIRIKSRLSPAKPFSGSSSIVDSRTPARLNAIAAGDEEAIPISRRGLAPR